MEYRTPLYAKGSPSRRSGGAAKWAAACALTAVLALALVTLQLFQLTSRSASELALRRALNAFVEGGAVVDRNYDDLRGRAEASQPGETLELRDYPVSVPLTREEVLASSRDQLRELLLTRAVERMYDDGTSALRRDGAAATGGRFTASGAVDEFVGFLRGGVHGILGIVTLVLVALSVVFALVLASLCRGFGRLVALGAVLVTAALPLLLGGLAMRIYMDASSGSGGEYLRNELVEIGATLSGLPIRNGLVLITLGGLMLVIGVICARWSDGRRFV